MPSQTLWTLGAIMVEIKQYDVFRLTKDINPKITRGMKGVILEIWPGNNFEVEFVKEDGTNYEFEGNFTFTIDETFIDKLVDR
jgi:hypothetical protein